MSRYKPTSQARAVLEHLAGRPHATIEELADLALPHRKPRPRRLRVALELVRALARDGFVKRRFEAVMITWDGEAALARLRAGGTIDTGAGPRVRIFARREAA
ncbi:MAG: hypothetical protein ACOY5Y_07205 [Pseudomonadota bacterium]